MKKVPLDRARSGGSFPRVSAFSAIGILALLVGKAAGGLAGRLAGGLAFAAAAGSRALGQVPGLQGLDSLHKKPLLSSPVSGGYVINQGYYNVLSQGCQWVPL